MGGCKLERRPLLREKLERDLFLVSQWQTLAKT